MGHICNTLETYSKEGIFSTQWKEQNILLLPALNNLLGNPPFFEYNKKDNEDSHLQRAHYPALKVANFTKDAVNFGRYCIVLGLDVKGGSNPDNRSQIKDTTIEIGVQQLPLGEDSLVEANEHAREYIATVSLQCNV